MRIEDKRSIGQAESDRFPWLTVKKVNRYKIANKNARLEEGVQDTKNDMIGKDVPKVKDIGSRFSLLDEGTDPILLEKPKDTNEKLTQEVKEGVAQPGPTQSPLGAKKSGLTHRVRNSKGGRNPQGSNKGKENKN